MFWTNRAICMARFELGRDFGVALLQLQEMLLELLVAEHRVVVVGRVVHDPAPKLRGGGTDAQRRERAKQSESFSSSNSYPFVPSEIGRHFVIVVVGQREIARQIDFDAMALADRDRRQNVEKLVENLRGRLSHALRKSLTHEVGAGRGEGAAGSGFGDGSESADGERNAEDAQVVVVDLIAQARCRRSG